MLTVVLFILKIIGIVILSIIGLLLLILLILLFVPIRYQIQSQKDEKLSASAKVSFLMHLLHIDIEYFDDINYKVRVFGFQIFPKKRNVSDKREKKRKPATQTTDTPTKPPQEQIEKFTNAKLESEHNREEHKNTETESRQKNKKKKFTFRSKYDKIMKDIKRIKKNISLIQQEKTKKAISKCKEQLIYVLKKILPRKMKGTISFGLDDPSLTGQIYGLYAMLYGVHHGKIIAIPYFDESVFKYNIQLKGHIRIYTVLIVFLKLYFDKDVKRLIRIFKQEDK